MDDHHCRYGIYTVYSYTWFLKRVDDTHLAVSQPISASSVSTSSALSLRECLLALVIAGADEERSHYPSRYGKRLVSSSLFVLRICTNDITRLLEGRPWSDDREAHLIWEGGPPNFNVIEPRNDRNQQELIHRNTFPEFEVLHCELIFGLPALNSEVHWFSWSFLLS